MGLTQGLGEDWGPRELDVIHQKSWLESLVPQLPAAARQSLSVTDSPLLIAILLGTVIVGAQLLPLLLPPPMLSPVGTGKLESDEMCGMTTGGQEECYWDCEIARIKNWGPVYGPDLSCLLDCYPDPDTRYYCITSLLKDVIKNKTCALQSNHGLWGTTDSCTGLEEGILGVTFPTIGAGTCSPTTENLLSTTECANGILASPSLLINTVSQLIRFSCTIDPPFLGLYPRPDEMSSNKTVFGSSRLAPVTVVGNQTTTNLDFTHTRHRYPWICSLRTKGANPEHLCAVTLLSVPPRPTVVVGAAHCTYLCKDIDNTGVPLPSCCCANVAEVNCANEVGRCGDDPKSVEMDGGDVDVLCGEWQQGIAPQELSGEKYNVFLKVIEIRRHPNFDASVGPSEGNDMAVFIVNDDNLAQSQDLDIHPVCLPPNKRKQPTKGVHSGWSQPPPLYFLEAYGGGFANIFREFYKQWHYSMDIIECKDPTVSKFLAADIVFPSDTFYPAGTICAAESTREPCFSGGDSGSPLMATEKDRPQRYYMEGTLSFVKGCDLFYIGLQGLEPERTDFRIYQYSENPLVYTKLSCFLPWVAEQYGLDYDGDPSTDPSCTQTSGQKPTGREICRETFGVENVFTREEERECIFPFFYQGQLFRECALLTLSDFVYPVFRCPVINSTVKTEWTDPDTGEVMMVNTFNATLTPLSQEPAPFSPCKNDCPGVRGLGIIGAGTVLFAATGIASVGLLSPPVLGLIGGVGLTLGGLFTASTMCVVPYCRAPQTGQCCLLSGSNTGVVCPPSC